MNDTRQLRPFGLRDKLGYLFGDFGNDFTFILSTMIIMKFYTDVMGVSAAAVGAVMMIARFVDAFTDVTMGRIVDRLPPGRGGKFRRWLKWGCVPVALSSFLIYQSGLANLPYGIKVAYLLVTYILWGSVCYTAINIPYGSMASAISPEPGDRQSLSTWRSMGATLAGAVIGVLLPLIAYEKVEGVEVLVGSRVTAAAGMFSLLAVVCYLLCYRLTAERVQTEPSTQAHKPHSVGRMLLSAVKNRALISIIAASILMLLSQLTMQNMAVYVFPDYYNNAAAQSVSTLLMTGAMALAALVSKPLALHLGKAEVSAAANLLAGLTSFIAFLLRPQSVWVFVALQTVQWLCLGVFTMMSWALITDVIDYAELQNGVREDGSVYALYSFARKLGQAGASGLVGLLLTWTDYVPKATGLQTQAMRESIYSIATLLPAIGFSLLAAVLWLWYPLRKRQVEQNVAALKEKHRH